MQEAFAISDDGKKVSKAQVAIETARGFLQHKLFFSPKHEVGLVMFGTAETSNELQDAEEGQYQHVFVARGGKIDVPDVDALRSLAEPPAAGQHSDPVDALIVALDLLAKRTGDLKYEKHIRLITDNSLQAQDPDLEECIKQLEAKSTKLTVSLVGSGQDAVWTSLAKSSEQVQLISLSDFASESRFSVKPVEQRAKVRLPLILSEDMQIPVGIYSQSTRVAFPTLKKLSKLAAAIPEENRRSDRVIMDRTYFATDDKEGEEVKKEDRVKGHKYGKSIVPMSEYDEAALMYTCERTLTTLGFANADCIGAADSMSHTEMVAADKGDRWASCAFEALVEAMVEEKRVLIARYCFRKDGQPYMVALIPLPRPGEASGMTMQFLPFFEDIREWTCASLPGPSLEQQQLMGQLVDSMSLVGFSETTGAPKELLRPEDTQNPALSRFYRFLAERAVDASSQVSTSAPDKASIIAPPPSVAEGLAKALPENERAKFNTLFGLAKVEKPGQGGSVKRYWREAISEKRKDTALIGEVDTKKIKVDPTAVVKKSEKEEEGKVKDEGSQGEDHGPGAMAAAVGLPLRVHIGSVHPERDFEHWLSVRQTGGIDTVGPAVEQMCEVILRFADEGEEFHSKALNCLATLRRGCVREGEASGYNEFLRRLRLKRTKYQALLWDRVSRDAALGLVTDTEVVTSTVSSVEAKAFLAGEDTVIGSAHASSSHPGATEGPSATALSEKDLEAMIE
eukprot:CAMPEP_0197691094 /NCGR_PEP_ID=MMETSP1338-20131121/109245_1 /TAXON_ID=43686 ORGANISM="Pelagodinium beii, Strain RCC1491" /NCGR_SAMPLE_ID=MMETSP1338 /ASSEMBLY_ACC=CAM_ASM_000754 /LENGTH=736 /DNA_ID=CAMNT_0043273605 /DNA_START=1 /DNA_END=2211 /DNA_ORIENTATION=+